MSSLRVVTRIGLCDNFFKSSRPFSLQFTAHSFRNATHRDAPRFALKQNQAARSTNRFRRPPPSNHNPNGFRRWLNSIPSSYVFWGILGLNGAVFCMWGYAQSNYRQLGNPSTYIWLRKNFLINLQNIKEGRIWTLLTACFSHEDTSHLLFNGLTYFFIAQPILGMLGNAGFLVLYLGGGIAAGLASLAWRSMQSRPRPNDSSHGASAAIYATLSYFACVQPQASFLIFGIVPVRAWMWVGFLFCYDSYAALNDKRSGTDTVGHVGGLLAGLGYFFARRAGLRI